MYDLVQPLFFLILFLFILKEIELKEKVVILPMFTHMEGSYRAAKGKRVKILAPGIGTRAERKKLCEIAETQKN